MVAAATSVAILARADNPTYVLGIPVAPTMYLSNDAEDNAWLNANANFAAMSVAATTGGVSRVVDVNSPRLALASAEAGFPFERAKPDYYLADGRNPSARTSSSTTTATACSS